MMAAENGQAGAVGMCSAGGLRAQAQPNRSNFVKPRNQLVSWYMHVKKANVLFKPLDSTC